MRPKPKMTPQLKALLERLARRPGDLQRLEPEGVDYTVRDPETGAVLEIVTTDGQRIYVGRPDPQR